MLDRLCKGMSLTRESALVAWQMGDLRPSAVVDGDCGPSGDREAEQQSSPRQLRRAHDILARSTTAAHLADRCQRWRLAPPSQPDLAGRGGALRQRASLIDPAASRG